MRLNARRRCAVGDGHRMLVVGLWSGIQAVGAHALLPSSLAPMLTNVGNQHARAVMEVLRATFKGAVSQTI